MPIGQNYTSLCNNTKTGFWVSPNENPVQPFNSDEFMKEFNEYVERKRQEDRWYKVTWFQDKVNFKTEVFRLVDCYEEAKSKNCNVEYFRMKLASKFKKTAFNFGGHKAAESNSDGSEMSKILMKYYYRLNQSAQPEVVNSVQEQKSPRRV